MKPSNRLYKMLFQITNLDKSEKNQHSGILRKVHVSYLGLSTLAKNNTIGRAQLLQITR